MILTVGDSFTYGDELQNRLEHAWPYKISKICNAPVTNLGQSGASNTYIFRTVVEAMCKNDYQLIIVQWSDPSRIELCNLAGEPRSITGTAGETIMTGPCRTEWVEEYYKKHYNDLYSYRLTACYIVALQELFKNRKQPYVMINLAGLKGYYTDYYNELQDIWNQVDKNYFVGWPNVGILDIQGDCPLASGGHPLELGHERIADEIAKYIRN